MLAFGGVGTLMKSALKAYFISVTYSFWSKTKFDVKIDKFEHF